MPGRRNLLPENPAQTYRGQGWAGWAKWLGTRGVGVVDTDKPVTVAESVRPILPASSRSWGLSVLRLPQSLDAATEDERGYVARLYLTWLEEIISNSEAWWERDLLLDALDRLQAEAANEITRIPEFGTVLAAASKARADEMSP